MKVAVTGGTGFIGRELVKRLCVEGEEVRVLSRRPIEVCALPENVLHFQGDLSAGTETLASFLDNVDVLYHCAGEIRNEKRMEMVHVEGTRNLCNAASGRIKQWVQLSSTGVYGFPRSGVVTEKTPENPSNLYEKTKLISDRIVCETSVRSGFTVTILRPSIVYGKQMPNQSIFKMISMIHRGLFFFIGRGNTMVNYVHVENVVAAMTAARTQQLQANTYILSESLPLKELVGIISSALGSKKRFFCIPEGITRLFSGIGSVIPGFPLTSSRIDFLTSEVVYKGDQAVKDLEHIRIPLAEGVEQLVVHWKQALEEQGAG